MANARSTRFAWLLALLSLFALVAVACGDDDDGDGASDAGGDESSGTDADGLLAQLQDRGTIRIGFANERPYGYEGDDGEPTGQAPEVAKLVLAELGIDDVEGVVVEFGSLIPGLEAGQFDMIAAGMFITPERAGQIIFSDPDYCASTAFAVAEGNPLGLEDFESFLDSDATIGVLSGAVEEGYAVETGIPDGQIVRFPDAPGAFDGLTADRVDAVALTDATVNTQVDELDGYEATEGFIPVIDGEEQLGCGGYGFLDQGLRDAFNDVLNEMKANDEILPIIEEFGFSEASVEAAKDVTVEDLAG